MRIAQIGCLIYERIGERRWCGLSRFCVRASDRRGCRLSPYCSYFSVGLRLSRIKTIMFAPSHKLLTASPDSYSTFFEKRDRFAVRAFALRRSKSQSKTNYQTQTTIFLHLAENNVLASGVVKGPSRVSDLVNT
jgi:hypothetical protein